MKKLFLVLLFGVFVVSMAYGDEQYFIAEPVDNPSIVGVEVKVIKGETVETFDVPYTVVNGEVRLLGLDSYPSGTYTFQARWIDKSGWRGTQWSEPLIATKHFAPVKPRIK